MSSKNGITFPQVDISEFESRKEKISDELGHAAREIGFFYVTGASLEDFNAFKYFAACGTVSHAWLQYIQGAMLVHIVHVGKEGKPYYVLIYVLQWTLQA